MLGILEAVRDRIQVQERDGLGQMTPACVTPKNQADDSPFHTQNCLLES